MVMDETMTINQQPAQQPDKTWWKDWFNEVYLDVYSHRDEEQADDEVHTALSVVPLAKHHKILDLCCGNGRHCRALHRSGFENITGLDFSKALLDQALRLEDFENYVRSDMKRLPFVNDAFDGVFSFFTSFGYFDDERNMRVLSEISRSLKHGGGWFLMDYLNPRHVKETLIPESLRQNGDYTITERRSLTRDQTRIEKDITIQKDGYKKEFHESVRLYTYTEMVKMWRQVDLHVLGALGGFDGRQYSETMPRMILYGTRI